MKDMEFELKDTKEVLKFCANGDIYVNGKLATNDLEVVNGMRLFLEAQRKKEGEEA